MSVRERVWASSSLTRMRSSEDSDGIWFMWVGVVSGEGSLGQRFYFFSLTHLAFKF